MYDRTLPSLRVKLNSRIFCLKTPFSPPNSEVAHSNQFEQAINFSQGMGFWEILLPFGEETRKQQLPLVLAKSFLLIFAVVPHVIYCVYLS